MASVIQPMKMVTYDKQTPKHNKKKPADSINDIALTVQGGSAREHNPADIHHSESGDFVL